jgi:multiple sugar transport system permease protein
MAVSETDRPARPISRRPSTEEDTGGITRDPSKYVFLLPAVILILLLSIFPLLFSLGLSFVNWDLSRLQGGIQFAGLNNFIQLMQDKRFWNTARVTLSFVVGGAALQYTLGLGIALLLNREIRFRRFFRVVFLLPMMLTPAAVGYLGRMLFNETQGPVNDIITHLGGPAIPWTSNSTLALPSLILVDTWEWVPFLIIVLLAGLQSLPPEVFEAATVDGANAWQTFRHITFPLLLPTSVTVILIRALEAFKLFDIVAVMTGGGPGTSTESVTWYTYLAALTYGRLGYASAMAYSLLIMVTIFCLLFLAATRRGVEASQ